ncbi:MAG: thiamine phosphate synthase [Planctomycetota bacterium]
MLPPWLVALSPGDLDPAGVEGFLARLEAALGAGLPGVLFREHRLLDAAWARAFARVKEAAGRAGGVWVGGHDRVHLALAGGADAVHQGFRSLPPERVRPLLPPSISLGLSTHAADDPAGWAAADYLFHGPVHATPAKEGWQAPIGLAGLGAAVAKTGRPVLAIGGLRPADVPGVLSAGARGLAVLSGILGAADPAAATREYLAAGGPRRGEGRR